MIQIDMNMPEACNKETYRNGYYIYEHCKLFDACNKAVLFRKNYKPDNCPLKEVSQEPILDKIKEEVLEYIDDLDIATEICAIFDKYKAESEVNT